MAYLSDELFHFVGRSDPINHDRNFAILAKILEEGCISYPPHEIGWGETAYRYNFEGKLSTAELVVPSVTCYCDIPLSELNMHVAKYGNFGVSFRRDFLIRYGARPVTYVPMSDSDRGSPFGRELLDEIEIVFHSCHDHFRANGRSVKRRLKTRISNPEEAAAALCSVVAKDLLAFIKPFNADIPTEHQGNYYSEREWRKHGNLMFSSKDIAHIVVHGSMQSAIAERFPELKARVALVPC